MKRFLVALALTLTLVGCSSETGDRSESNFTHIGDHVWVSRQLIGGVNCVMVTYNGAAIAVSCDWSNQ